jgi:hypothetical protein
MLEADQSNVTGDTMLKIETLSEPLAENSVSATASASATQVENYVLSFCRETVRNSALTLDSDLLSAGVSSMSMFFMAAKILDGLSLDLESNSMAEVLFSRPTPRSLALWIQRKCGRHPLPDSDC